MWDLQFVAVHDDGEHVVVRCADLDDEHFLLPVTDDLRDAVAPPPVRAASPTAVGHEQLTPREIQARIRGGESPEELARATGLPFAKVDRYAGPVLSERAHVAASARAARLPGARDADAAASLGDIVLARLDRDGVHADEVTWDAWRRDDGVWMLQVAYPADGARHTAEWSWDPGRQQLRPYGAAARALSTIEPPSPDEPVDPRIIPPGLRMVPIPAPDDRAGGGRRGSERAASEPVERVEPTARVEPTERPQPVEPVERHPVIEPVERQPVVARDIATAGASVSDDAEEQALLPLPESAAQPPATVAQPPATVAQPPAVAAGRPERRSRSDRKGRLASPDPRHVADAGKAGKADSAKGRPSVPSWDDILFGVRRQQ